MKMQGLVRGYNQGAASPTQQTQPDTMGHLRAVRPDQEKNERRLESWKEIASFFERDEKTVRRWERDLGLPVHCRVVQPPTRTEG